jgi:hypothetical protein
MTILGKERFFVIPNGTDIWELAREDRLEISDEIIAQTSGWDKALMITYALNYNRLMKASMEKSSVRPDQHHQD